MGVGLLQSPVLLRAARRVQTVNDKPVKDLNLLFSVYFIWKWGETFKNLDFSTFEPKQCFYLTHSTREYFEKLAFKKNKKFNFKRLYLKDSGKFRELTFSEIWFNFVQKRLFFVRSNHMSTRLRVLPAYNARWCYQRRDELKELMMRQ